MPIHHVGHLRIDAHLSEMQLDEIAKLHVPSVAERLDGLKPDPEKIQSAVATLKEKFPADDVSLYLQTLVCQDPETWGALRETLEASPA